jgi:hemerythrin-like domain-containing protein
MAVKTEEAIQDLTEEHREVLGKLEEMGRAVAALKIGAPAEEQRAALEGLAAFFREELERHLRKEEEGLFPALEPYLSRAAGPLAVMLMEHKEMRSGCAAFAEAVRRLLEEGDPSALRNLEEIAGGYTALLRSHIMKEDQVLFPMAGRLIQAPEWAGVRERMAVIGSQPR